MLKDLEDILNNPHTFVWANWVKLICVQRFVGISILTFMLLKFEGVIDSLKSLGIRI